MALMGEAKPRKRRFEPKVRTGCNTCKLRRVKCGEERPICQRCVSAGRTCDGYDTIRLAETSTAADGAIVLSWAQPSSQPPDTNTLEQSAFHFFRMHVVDSLPGPFDASIWYRQVLPVSMTEPPVRHAIIALGSLRRKDDKSWSQEKDEFALQHYSRAMRALQNKIAEQKAVSPDLTLIICLLFIAFEFQRNGFLQAFAHLESGLKIIRELQDDSTASHAPPKSVMDPLAEAFERLDIQMSLFTSSRVHLNQAIEDARMASLPAETRFRDIAHASRPFNIHMSAMREIVFAIESRRFSPAGLSAEDYRSFQSQVTRQLVSLNHWELAMTQLLPRLSNEKDIQAGRLLRMHYICCKLMVSTALSDGQEMLWDSFLSDFQGLLELAEDAVTVRLSQQSGSEHLPNAFSLDMGIIPPCYFTAIKCRDPKLRRRALKVLQDCKHQEGAWYGPIHVSMAEAIVHLEERGLDNIEQAADVPERNRLYQAWYDLTQGAGILFCRRRCFELDGSWTAEYRENVEGGVA